MTGETDVLIVGGGVAAPLVALLARSQKLTVSWIRPPPEPKALHLAGGILWHADLQEQDPAWPKGAPLGRQVVGRRFLLLTSESALALDYRDESWGDSPTGPWVLERSKWQDELRDRAVNEGVTLIEPSLPTALLQGRVGEVTGVKIGDRSYPARVTVFEDARSSSWAKGSGLRLAPDGTSRPPVATARESVFELPPGRVDDRFGAGPGRGVTVEAVLGQLPKGARGYGYVYPGEKSVVAGVVAHRGSSAGAGISLEQVSTAFETHPAIAPYLREGKRLSTVEVDVPGGPRTLPKLFGDGFLQIGAAASTEATRGLVLASTDLEVRSAALAAETVLETARAKDGSARVTSRYGTRLGQEGLLEELASGGSWAARWKWNPRLHAQYPRLFQSLFRTMMTEHGQPKEHMRELLRGALQGTGVPYTALGRDLLAVIGSL